MMSRKIGKIIKKTKFLFFFMQNTQKHPGARGASGCGKGTGQKAPKAKGSPGREKPPTGGPKGAQPMAITKAHRGKNRMLSRVVSTTLSAAGNIRGNFAVSFGRKIWYTCLAASSAHFKWEGGEMNAEFRNSRAVRRSKCDLALHLQVA